jgi:hypothetical protein
MKGQDFYKLDTKVEYNNNLRLIEAVNYAYILRDKLIILIKDSHLKCYLYFQKWIISNIKSGSHSA